MVAKARFQSTVTMMTVLLNLDICSIVFMFCRTVLLDTLAQEGACTLATVSRVTVTAIRTPVTQRLASARYESLPARSSFLEVGCIEAYKQVLLSLYSQL